MGSVQKVAATTVALLIAACGGSGGDGGDDVGGSSPSLTITQPTILFRWANYERALGLEPCDLLGRLIE